MKWITVALVLVCVEAKVSRVRRQSDELQRQIPATILNLISSSLLNSEQGLAKAENAATTFLQSLSAPPLPLVPTNPVSTDVFSQSTSALEGLFPADSPAVGLPSPIEPINQARHTTPRNPLGSLLTAANTPTNLKTQPPKDLVDACFEWLYNALEQGRNIDTLAAETLPPAIMHQLQTRQITPDSILSQFSAEQRQRLQNLRSKRDRISPIARSLHTDDYNSRQLRNLQILRALQSRTAGGQADIPSILQPSEPLTTTTAAPFNLLSLFTLPTTTPAPVSSGLGDLASLLTIFQSPARANTELDNLRAAVNTQNQLRTLLEPFLRQGQLSRDEPQESIFENRADVSLVDSRAGAMKVPVVRAVPVKHRSTPKPSTNSLLDHSAGFLTQLLSNGPNQHTVIDTGKERFDRFLVHKYNRFDTLGLPLANDFSSRGLIFNDDNLTVVNQNSKNLFGQRVGGNDNSFTLPPLHRIIFSNK